MKIIIYIAGPMTGIAEFNRQAFISAESTLTQLYPSARILNPVTLDEENGLVLSGATGNELVPLEAREIIVRRCVEAVLSSTHIYMLNGWELSTGARGEHSLAIWACRTVLYQSADV